MSTILDALKRSEQERKLNKIPTLSDMPAPQERPRWPLFLTIVLALLLLAVFLWLFVGLKMPVMNTTVTNSGAEQNVAVSNTSSDDASVDAEVSNSEPVRVSVISYAQEPNARFVIANGKMLREGEFVMAGVKIESILMDSVVLIERGKRVTLKP